MPKLRRISGKTLVKILATQGFGIVRQKGSHVRLTHSETSIKYSITVPLHNELDRGTLKAIIRSLRKCLSEETIQELFY